MEHEYIDGLDTIINESASNIVNIYLDYLTKDIEKLDKLIESSVDEEQNKKYEDVKEKLSEEMSNIEQEELTAENVKKIIEKFDEIISLRPSSEKLAEEIKKLEEEKTAEQEQYLKESEELAQKKKLAEEKVKTIEELIEFKKHFERREKKDVDVEKTNEDIIHFCEILEKQYPELLADSMDNLKDMSPKDRLNTIIMAIGNEIEQIEFRNENVDTQKLKQDLRIAQEFLEQLDREVQSDYLKDVSLEELEKKIASLTEQKDNLIHQKEDLEAIILTIKDDDEKKKYKDEIEEFEHQISQTEKDLLLCNNEKKYRNLMDSVLEELLTCPDAELN